MKNKSKLAIVILDRGWVFIGRLEREAGGLTLSNAACIRRWGTLKGIGQLALEGPQKDTVLDAAGTVRVPDSALIAVIETSEKAWPDR